MKEETSTLQLFDYLKSIPFYDGKLDYIDSEYFEINCHKYLNLSVSIEGEYLEVNSPILHWHPDYAQAIEFLKSLSNDKVMFVEYIWPFKEILSAGFIPRIRVFPVDKYRKFERKYMSMKRVRIYNGSMIFKEANKPWEHKKEEK